jgi:SNF2 family DNA or RNA helicase
VTKNIDAKWFKKWNCYVAPWTSFNCAKLIEIYCKFGIQVPDDVSEAGAAIVANNKNLFPHAASVACLAGLSTRCNENLALKRDMWTHHKDAINKLHSINGAVLDMGMGTGKSLTAIGLIMSGKHDNGIIVCPKSVIDVWPLEFYRNSKKDFHILPRGKETIKKFVENIEKEKHNASVYNKPFVIVCNYEAYWQGDLADYLLNNHFDYIVYDEAHRLKSHNGRASKFAMKMRTKADRVIGGTGTLLPHSPLDAFAIYRAIDPGIFGTSFIAYKSKYAILGGFEGKQVVAYKDIDDLNEKIGAISFRIKTEDAVDLPEVQHIERYCELTPKTRRLYEEMKTDMIASFDGHVVEASNALVKLLRLMQCTSGIIKDTEGDFIVSGTEKADLFEDILLDIDIVEPVVVFCNFTADIAAVRAAAEKQGRTVSELSGKKNELKDWQEGNTNVLVVQIKAGKEGVDFTRSNICFYYSIGHSLGDYLQSERRVHRPGQTRPVVYYHLLAKNTIDSDIYAALDKKHDIVLGVLDGLGIKTKQSGETDVR